MQNILIIGSSPVSLIYSLLLSRINKRSIIYSGNNIGGAWSVEITNDQKTIEKATHVFMYSEGLIKIFDIIGYKPILWEDLPCFINTKNQDLDIFSGPNETKIIGSPNDPNFFTFLFKKISQDKNVIFYKSKSIKSINIKKNLVEINESDERFSGLVLPSGINTKLYIEDIEIPQKEYLYDVNTLSFLIARNDKVKNSFKHFKCRDSIFREIQINKFSKSKSQVVIKLSSSADKNDLQFLEKKIKDYFYDKYNLRIFIDDLKSYSYENRKYIKFIEKSQYEKTPIIIPGYIHDRDPNLLIKDMQDLSVIFNSFNSINNELLYKFK